MFCGFFCSFAQHTLEPPSGFSDVPSLSRAAFARVYSGEIERLFLARPRLSSLS